MASNKSFQLKHDTLGTIIGLDRGDDIVQFRGIPYADIPARFRQAVRRRDLPRQPFDAINPGYTCPQHEHPFPAFWSGPLGPDNVAIPMPERNELGCLNLNITSYVSVLSRKALLPVLVFIHGGGFATGSSSIQIAEREIYDPRNVARAAAEMGKPIVVVTINYRVGALGFLASRELAEFNKSHNEPIGNYGLHDQRQALEWIHEFIAGFSGDRSNVTIMGGSAGGASCHFQCIFRNRRFKRAIISSGNAAGLGPLPLEQHQQTYEKYAQPWGTGENALLSIQKLAVHDLVNMHIRGLWHAVIDGDWIKGRTIQQNPIEGDPPEYMIGCCAYEDDVMLAGLSRCSGDQALKDVIHTSVSESSLTMHPPALLDQEMLRQYNLEEALKSPSSHLATCGEFLTDINFRISTYQTCLEARQDQKVYLYEFQATSPYTGWSLGYGKANHAISDMFFFDAPTEELLLEKHREEYTGAVKQLREEWLSFCYGQLTWETTKRLEGDLLGPVYTFANYGKGRRYERFNDVVGQKLVDRWLAALSRCKA